MNKLLILAAFWMVASVSYANIVVSPGVSYISNKYDQTTPSADIGDSTQTLVDVRLGYILPMGLYLGAMYSHIGGDDASSSGNMMGPTVGYFSSMTGFYTLLTYHISGEFGDTTKYTGAQGPQVDLGWIFPVTRYFSIGPQLTWRSIEFSKIESGPISVDTDFKRSTVAPYISLWFMF